MKGYCFCDKKASGEYPLDCCSIECLEKVGGILESINEAMKRQNSKTIKFGPKDFQRADEITQIRKLKRIIQL